MRVSCTDADWRDTQVILDAVPLGSEFEPQVGQVLDSSQNGWHFTPDKGGIFQFTVNALDANGAAIVGETATFQLEVGHRLTKQVGLNEDPPVAPATLVVFVWNEKVRGTPVDAAHPEYTEVTARLDPYPSSSLSRAAVQNASVIAAVDNLTLRDADDIVSTYFPAVESAYVAALADPGTIATEHPGAVTLIDDGGFK
jgi:hypothetical protein